jgi:hypothetical protein
MRVLPTRVRTAEITTVITGTTAIAVMAAITGTTAITAIAVMAAIMGTTVGIEASLTGHKRCNL